jgi:hypothetical protein
MSAAASYGFVTVPEKVLDLPGLSWADRAIVARVLALSEASGACRASTEWLAGALRMPVRTFERRLAGLCDRGYLHRQVVGDGKAKGNKRRLLRAGPAISTSFASPATCGGTGDSVPPKQEDSSATCGGTGSATCGASLSLSSRERKRRAAAESAVGDACTPEAGRKGGEVRAAAAKTTPDVTPPQADAARPSLPAPAAADLQAEEPAREGTVLPREGQPITLPHNATRQEVASVLAAAGVDDAGCLRLSDRPADLVRRVVYDADRRSVGGGWVAKALRERWARLSELPDPGPDVHLLPRSRPNPGIWRSDPPPKRGQAPPGGSGPRQEPGSGPSPLQSYLRDVWHTAVPDADQIRSDVVATIESDWSPEMQALWRARRGPADVGGAPCRE